jgi:hypothetical protein
MRILTAGLPVVWLVTTSAVASAAQWARGQAIVPFTLSDQHDRPHEIGSDVRLVLVSYDMDGGALVREALDGAPADTLTKAGAVYVANVVRMPGFVTRLFALPRMRRRPYPVLLDRDGRATGSLIARDGEAIAVRLENGTVTSIEPLTSVTAVRSALGLGRPAAD